MYFVYKNNMQMYLIKDAIVIKTWNKVYQFPADKRMFEAIQELVGFINTPKTLEEIEEFFSHKQEFNMKKTIAILLKAKVIMMMDSLQNLQNTLIYRYENGEEIMERMAREKIEAVNIRDGIRETIQKAGMRIGTEEGDYLLIWNDGDLDQLQSMFDKYNTTGKKMILAGIHKGNIYCISCDKTCNDIRRAYYLIKKNEAEGKVISYQLRIAEKILENKCLEYFFAGRQEHNFTLIAPDLSIINERLQYNMLGENMEKRELGSEGFEKNNKRVDYPELDSYINQLPFVGYFGSNECRQMPLPQQTLWILDRKGEPFYKVFAKGDTCENAMLNCIRKGLVYIYGNNKKVISISDNKEDYYFEALGELLFKTDRDNVEKIGKVTCVGGEAACFKHAEIPIYMCSFICGENSKTVYARTGKELKKKLQYGLIELGSRIEESVGLAEELSRECQKEDADSQNGDINESCVKYLNSIGYLIFEKRNPYSREMKNKGIYLGEFLIEG